METERRYLTTGDVAKECGVSSASVKKWIGQAKGLEVCRRVKANPATQTTRILAITAFTEEATAQEARRSGADGFLRKPLRLDDLKAEVERLIHARRPTRGPTFR